MADTSRRIITLGKMTTDGSNGAARTEIINHIATLEAGVRILEDRIDQRPLTPNEMADYAYSSSGRARPSLPSDARTHIGGDHSPMTSEMQLVQAIRVLQKQTGQTHLARGLVGQYMVSVGSNDKVYKFRTICRNAERMGLVELGNGGPTPEWITLRISARTAGFE